MKLKNNSSSVISVGSVVILPGKTEEVSGYDNNPVISALVKRKSLTVVKAAAKGGK